MRGPEAAKQIGSAEFAEPEGLVDEKDPTKLKKGQEIEVWPVDYGFKNKDRGRLVALTGKEVVIESKTSEGKVVRVHAPRHGFRLAPVENDSKL